MMYEKRQLGLLDDTLVGSVYNNYVNLAKEKGNYRTDLSTAGGVNTGGGIHSRGSKGDAAKRWRHNAAMDYYKSQTHDAKPKQSAWQLAQEQINKFPGGDFDQKFAKKEAGIIPGDSGSDLKKHHGGNEQDQQKWWQQLAAKMGLDFDKAAANWKDKGGFEGLMANPAFTMGLAFMQAGAEGKTIGQGALDNVMKAGGISQHYKKILEDRKQEPIQVTAEDMDEVKGLLKAIGIEEGNIFEKVWSRVTGQGNQQVKFDLAVHEIAAQFEKEVRDWQAKNVDAQGNPKIIRPEDKIKILRELIKNKKVKYKKSIFDVIGMSSTIEKEIPPITSKAEGGPVQAGQPYLVGEEGPEVIIPHSSGNVLSNDDSQIYAMLLAANPQLQKVSKARAERILRSRFPEYFE